ncbi:MAG: DUF2721 domain-containing protein, partial [Chloroflexota bacterium]|nr:DUF2721 domain-containing protein [Chloroflexota bacterium]
AEPFERERLREVDAQLPMLVRRLRRLHDCVLALDSAVVVFILDMFVIAGAAATGQTAIATLALTVFLAGNTAVLAGSVLGLSEVMAAQHAVEYEVERVLALTDDKASPHRHERS